ncbi:MAG: tRNA guanosine(34) transglycosylase Tgt [Leptospiraceae bacterium]|nr:tRNA guanosine(34) transglycosylase Tgt [Leptospiraceae bacterium]MCK6381814.1 tRNA guanosine(34) transglycosylase Tgt [Leptospiraceae bacterium]NUM42235.1 tRNA guanosine(34) transglycosylase Tgt [Leptospiraceae bacterium]
MLFEIKKTDPNSFARVGVLNLQGIQIPTPIFMPVGTRGSIKTLSSEDIESLNLRLILGNTYHLYLRPGTEVLEKFGGLKNFMSYKNALLTDSGGFQVFSLQGLVKFKNDGVEFQSHIDGSRHIFTPEKVIDIQKIIGSDIMMVLDDCPAYGTDTKRISESLERTHSWAKKSIEHWEKTNSNQNLFGICQGGTISEFRQNSLKKIQDLPFSGIALGGLSVGEPREEFVRILSEIAPFLDRNRPRYLMGVGTVPDILDGVKNGIDMFDCVLPTRNARNAQVFTSTGKINLRNEKYKFSEKPLDSKCNCRVCKNYSLGYLRHLHTVKEMLAFSLSTYHNLFFMENFMEKVRISIKDGYFSEEYAYWKNLYKN